MTHSFLTKIALVPLMLLLGACNGNESTPETVDLNVHFKDAVDLSPGSKVEFGGVTIGEVVRVVAGDDDTTVELKLDADKAGVVQKNAAAAVSGVTTPTVQIINPAEATADTLTIADGDSLRGLNSSLEEAAWHAGKAIGMLEGVMQQATQSFNQYLESDEWQNTRREVETGLTDLTEQSAEAAETIRKNVEKMMAELEAQSGETVREAEKNFGEIEKQFRDLGEKGGTDIMNTVEQFLESLREAMESGRQRGSGKIEA